MYRLLRPMMFAASATVLIVAQDAAAYLHPDARFLMGIELQRIANSSTGGMLRKQITAATAARGFDLLADVERILISSPGQRAGSKESSPDKNTKAAAGEAPVLMAITGHFDLQKLRELAVADGEVLARYGPVELIAPPHGKTASMHFGLISPRLILAGDAISLREAIDRSTLPPAGIVNPGLFRRATALAGTSDVWVTATISPSELGLDSVPAVAMFRDVKGMEMAMTLQQGLDLRLTLRTRNREAAVKISNAVLGLTQIAGIQGSHAGGADLLKALTLKTEGASITATLAVDSASLERSIVQIRDLQTHVATQRPLTQTRPALSRREIALQPPEAPREKRFIRIMGADDGPKEIPFDPPASVKP